MSTRRPASGFTLIELVCAMAIAALLALTLYGALATGFRAKKSAAESVGPARTGAIVLELMARDIEQAVGPSGVLAGAMTGTPAVGTTAGAHADTLDFYCIGEDATPARQSSVFDEGIRHVAYRLDNGSLVRSVERNLLSTVTNDPPEDVLCENVKSLAITYYDGTTWTDTCDSTGTGVLPLAVRVELELTGATNTANAANATSVVVSRVMLLSTGTAPTTGGT